MDVDREEQLVIARREEAQALLHAGQATKERTDRILGFGVTAVGVAAAAGIANHFPQVMLAIPTALSLLLTYVFQLYSDLAALEIARARVESVLATQLGEEVLIAEVVAPVRHGGRMNPSIPLTQGVYVVLVIGSAIAGGVTANSISLGALLLYLVVTVLAVVALLASRWDLRHTSTHAQERVATWPRQRTSAPDK